MLPKAPKKGTLLPHQGLDERNLMEYSALGYTPVDVRLQSGLEAVRLTLQGIRMGTILPSKELLERLELEAKIEKVLESAKPQLAEGAVELSQILSALPTTATISGEAPKLATRKKK